MLQQNKTKKNRIGYYRIEQNKRIEIIIDKQKRTEYNRIG